MHFIIGHKDELSSELLAKLSKYRYEVFIKKLGWQLPTEENVEQDQFDNDETVYVIANDEENNVIGCARLLPTTSPYLLRDVFPHLLGECEPPSSYDVWEVSRFSAVDLNPKKMNAKAGISSECAVQLIQQSINYVYAQGAKQLITVSPLGIERLLSRAGFQFHRTGVPIVVDGRPVVSCLISAIPDVECKLQLASQKTVPSVRGFLNKSDATKAQEKLISVDRVEV